MEKRDWSVLSVHKSKDEAAVSAIHLQDHGVRALLHPEGSMWTVWFDTAPLWTHGARPQHAVIW